MRRTWLSRVREPRQNVPVVLGAFWFLWRYLQYPAGFLFPPDGDIWIVQLGIWIWLAFQGCLVAWLAYKLIQWAQSKKDSRWSRLPTFDKAADVVTRFLDYSRHAPLFFGLLSGLAFLWAWGSFHAPTRFPDDIAYLFQAKLFASGRWVAPPAPIPKFFQEIYVWGTHTFRASKYPPGFSLALAPGILLGLPALVPVILAGVTGGFLFALARKAANPWVALLAWLFWTTETLPISGPPAYSSEYLTGALGLASWWFLWKWMDQRRPADLCFLSLCLAWGAITRPLTMLAFLIPIAVVIARRIRGLQVLRDLVIAGLLGCLILAVVPLWSFKTIGTWKTNPLQLYIRTYMPSDTLGIKPTRRTPLKILPADLEQEIAYVARDAKHHDLAAFPSILATRSRILFEDTLGGWRFFLWPAVALGLICLPAPALLALLTAISQMLLYLFHPHPPALCNYYLEIHPIFDFFAAYGLWVILETFKRNRASPPGQPPRRLIQGRFTTMLISVLILSGPSFGSLFLKKGITTKFTAYSRFFREGLGTLPAKKGVVFYHFSSAAGPHHPILDNEPDLNRARFWIVRDLGAKNNLELIHMAPDRVPYVFDEATRRFMRGFPEIKYGHDRYLPARLFRSGASDRP